MIKIFHKSRKYPIQKDVYGRSLRKRCFVLFEQGLRPAQVARELNMDTEKTAFRYFQDWKKLPKDLEPTYKSWRKVLKNDSGFSDRLVVLLAEVLDMSNEEVIARLEKPWGLKKLLKGDWVALRSRETQSKQEARLLAALFWVNVIETQGVSPEWIKKEFNNILSRARGMKVQQQRYQN